jgi:hypothetical protein
MNPRTLLAATAGGVLLAAVLAGPAQAEEKTYDDPADATASLTDIRTVSIDHGPTKVRIEVGFTDLRRRSAGGAAGLTIMIDTTKQTKGAELGLTTGLQDGTDYQLLRITDGHPVGEPLTCYHRVRLGFAADVLAFEASRSCLGDPSRVRIGVKMRDDFDSSHPVVDWLGRPKSWTTWVRSS